MRKHSSTTYLKTVPPFPDYYRRMKRVNANGPKLLDAISGGEAVAAREFRETLKTPDAVLIDPRRPEAVGGSHVSGSFNIGAEQNLSIWAGWVVPYDRPMEVAHPCWIR